VAPFPASSGAAGRVRRAAADVRNLASRSSTSSKKCRNEAAWLSGRLRRTAWQVERRVGPGGGCGGLLHLQVDQRLGGLLARSAMSAAR
jgi:hypothetical protein